MDLLREFIHIALSEAARGPDDLPEDWRVRVKQRTGDDVVVQLLDGSSIMGEVGLHRADEHDGPCSNAWVVSLSHATEGWGPMLYDVAIEWATMHGSGLTPDRDSVSDDAAAVWSYYMKRRSDVSSDQLDSMTNVLTSVEVDNCHQVATSTHAGKFEREVEKDDLLSSPLARVYSKQPTMMRHLVSLGRIET